MEAGKFLIAQSNGDTAQFSGLVTENYENITTATQLSTTSNIYVRVKPTGGEAWIQIASTAITPASGEGAYIDSTEYFIVPKDFYIGASAEINVVPAGFEL